MQIAFEERMTGLEQKDLAFMCEALNIQLREHLGPAWALDGQHWPVKAYSSLKKLPVGTFWPIAILPTLDIGGAAGYHAWEAGLAYGKVRWSQDFDTTTVVSSHESCELRIDPRCNRWVALPDGRAVALEVSDPVQEDSYSIKVELFGEKRNVWVSDFVLPSYFVPNAPPPYSFMNSLDANFSRLGLSEGGYLMIREKNGDVRDYWGRKLLGAMKQKAPDDFVNKEDPHSRTLKRRGGQLGELIQPQDLIATISKGESK